MSKNLLTVNISDAKIIGKINTVTKYPWFELNNCRFVLYKTTFDNVIANALDYIIDGPTDCTVNVNSKDYITITLQVQNIKIVMTFQNISNTISMRESCILQQFSIEYEPSIIQFDSYIPFNTTEYGWKKISEKHRLIKKVSLGDVNIYKYPTFELWFDTLTGKLVRLKTGVITERK